MRLFIVDFSNLFLTFYAVFKNTKNLIPLVANYLLKFLNTNTSQFLFVYEFGNPVLKEQIFPDYKKNRAKYIHPDVFKSIQLAKREMIKYLTENNFKLAKIDNIEADDLIAYFVWKLKDAFSEIIIVSNDYDFVQLIDYSKIKLITRKHIFGFTKISDNLYLSFSKLGSSKDYLTAGVPYLYFKILIGDSGDNIPASLNVRTKKKILKKIFSISNRQIIDNQKNVESFSDFENFIKATYDEALKYLNYQQAELNLRLMALYPNFLPKEIDLDAQEYLIPSQQLKLFLLNKKFLL